jgi:Calcium binding
VRPDERCGDFQGPLNRPLRLPAVPGDEDELDELVEQAIVDAYGDDEQLVGLYTMISDNLALPFTTTVLGVEADVVKVDVTDSGIVAICAHGADRQAISILDLRLPVPAPPGSEWIAAYRRWAAGQ